MEIPGYMDHDVDKLTGNTSLHPKILEIYK